MPATGAGETDVAFDPVRDPFRTKEVQGGEDDEDEEEGLDDKYRQLALDLFGETKEERRRLLAQLREQIAARGYRVPTRKAFLVKLLRAGQQFCT